MRKLLPLQDRVLVSRSKAEETTVGGIYIPPSAQEKMVQGEVLAIGSGSKGPNGTVTPLSVLPGDVVLFGKYAGTEVVLDGRELLILREDDLLGVLLRE